MPYTLDVIQALLPVAASLLLIAGKVTRHKNFIVIALWTSLMAIILHYQTSGGEILGSYFDYRHALFYSLNIIVLLICTIDVLLGFASESRHPLFRYLTGLAAAAALIGVTLLIANVWINAWFIENRMQGTPVLQVASFRKLPYCTYYYVFYRISENGKMSYMCPNYYGLIPSAGYLETPPDYVIRQLPRQLQAKFHLIP